MLISTSLIVNTLIASETSEDKEIDSLVATVESLQQPIEDFGCEFEGTLRYQGILAEHERVGKDGLSETFSGSFIWNQVGDIHCETLRRREFDGLIARESLVIRMRKREAEQYYRLNDAPVGYSQIEDAKTINYGDRGGLRRILLLDDVKQQLADAQLEPSIHNGQTDGRPVKILDFTLKDSPDMVVSRYHIDMRRSGHVIRAESFIGKKLGAVINITLAPFKVGEADVWMPVSGECLGYGAIIDNKPTVVNAPTSVWKIYVVGGTAEINTHPGTEVFTVKYRPGTMISDSLRKMTYEFGQQKIGLKPTKAEAERMLAEEVVRAEEQKKELIVASTSQDSNWISRAAWGFGCILAASSLVLLIRRRRR